MIVQMRCPDCHKLYQTQVQVPMTIEQQGNLSFTCEQCHQQFSICDEQLITAPPMPAELQATSSTLAQPYGTLFIQTRRREISKTINKKSSLMISCPRCQAQVGKDDIECRQCGIILAKANGGQPHLEKKWQEVLQDFDNIYRHQVFMKTCKDQDQLLFALEKYRDLYSVLGDSQICAQRIEELESQLQIRHMKGREVLQTSQNRYLDYVLPLSPYIFSAGLIFMGLLKPGNRNFIGFGVMLFILVTGIRFFWLGPKRFLNLIDHDENK